MQGDRRPREETDLTVILRQQEGQQLKHLHQTLDVELHQARFLFVSETKVKINRDVILSTFIK